MAPPSPPPLQLHPTLSIFLLLLLLRHATAGPPTDHPDLAALLSFKSTADVSDNLSSWNNSSDPCNNSSAASAFYGVSCLHNRVTSLVLEGLGLHGRFDSLTGLVKLRLLSLKRNRLAGPIPDLSNLKSLKLLFLSYNQISGGFPPALPSLFRLDLSYNNLSGDIPPSLNRLTRLLTLRLEENRFSGSIRFLDLPNLREFNMSMNNISGEIPESLSGFPESVFSNNPVLCGFPLPKCTRPKIPSPVISSSPTSLPSTAAVPERNRRGGGGRMSTVVVVAIIIGDVLVLGLVSVLLYFYFCQDSAGKSEVVQEGKQVCSPPAPSANSSFEKGRMVFFDGTRRFELEDLLRASAEMLGKGGLGTAYKAVLDDGNVVAVKRLKEVVIGGKREFEQQMEVLGRLRHPNVVSLKAYYFAKDEKLLVYDYMTNGNLFSLLHGNRGPGRTPLDWSTRLKIAVGVAKGLAFVHTSGGTPKLTHGNIKSTNVLIDKSGNGCVSDVGLSAFTPTTAFPRSFGYRAPELSSATNRKSTQKSDIYSFGILVLELLTGKCPSAVEDGGVVDLPRWVQSVVREEWTAEVFDLELMSFKDTKEEMVRLMRIALLCTLATPDQRPDMGQVVKMIHDIEGVEMSPSGDMLDSVSNSPSLIEA